MNAKSKKYRFFRIGTHLLLLFLLIRFWGFFAIASSPAQSPVSGSETIPADSLTNTLGSWIWASTVSDNQTVRMWKSFEIPASIQVKEAQLYITADNEFDVYLDGRDIGQGAEWRELSLLNIGELLTPGRHVLAVRAFNSYSYAGMVLGLPIELIDGSRFDIKSDGTWKIVPDGVKDWQNITKARANWPPANVEVPWDKSPWKLEKVRINIMPTPILVKVPFWQTGWFQILLLVVWGVVIVASFWLLLQLVLHRNERWLLQRERNRIARDIHDDLGSKMTQLVLQCEVTQHEFSSVLGLHSQLDVIIGNVREMLSTLGEILWAVNPRQDTLREFASYVCSYTEQFLKSTSINYFFDVPQEVPTSTANLPFRRGLLMALKEALNNAVKHSGATELRLQIRFRHERLIVTLLENGKGFDPAKTRENGRGITYMTQRMRELGGTCVVSSQPDKGCRVEFNVPLKPLRWRLLNQ